MIYRQFQDKQLSMLGYGCMRFPTREDETIDEEQVKQLVSYAREQGINYFDTAYFYHNGASEEVIGRVLSQYPRDSFYLATKYPGSHITGPDFDPARLFEEQLQKCGVEYFDFYLLHNVCERNVEAFTDPQFGVIDYLKEQKRLGRIRHLGFSTHAKMECLTQFLEAYGKDMEFCQIQLNYLDWTLQDAAAKYELLTRMGIPVWVMEPVRGGKLAKLRDWEESQLKALEPDASIASWGFRFLQGLSNVTMVLSGMSNLEQVQDNIRTFSVEQPLTEEKTALLLQLAEGMKNSIPCTACRYCCDGCPQQLDIPSLLAMYNELRFSPAGGVAERIGQMDETKRPSACIACGQCSQACPQNIDIPAMLQEFAQALDR